MAQPVTAVSALRGQRHIAAETSTQLKPDVLDRIVRWNPNRSPFITLMKMTRKSRSTMNRKYELWEQRPPKRFVTVVSDNGTTSITVSAADSKHVKDAQLMICLRTGGVFRVAGSSGVNTTTGVLTVTRAWGSSPTTTLAADDQLLLIGTAFADGTRDGTAIDYLQENVYNYTQIHKSSYEWSRRARVQQRYGGYDVNDARMEGGFQHKEEIERALLFGRRNSTTDSDGKEITSTQGLVHYLSTNLVNFGVTAPTKRAFYDALEPVYRYGTGAVGDNGMGEKHALCSPAWLSHLDELFGDQVADDTVQLPDSERKGRTVGFHVKNIVMTHGTLYLHRMQDWATSDDLKGRMVVIDPNELALCYLEGGQTKLLKDRQENDADYEKGTYLTDCGLDLTVEAAHGDFRASF
jgi:hypothetical protein